MSYIPAPIVVEELEDPLRHALKDRDPYVRKTAAICVAKLYNADPRKCERNGFVELLRDLLLDTNATVVANAVAALIEIGDRQDGVIFKLNLTVANKLLAALPESSEYALFRCFLFPMSTEVLAMNLQVGTNIHTRLTITLCTREARGCANYGGTCHCAARTRKLRRHPHYYKSTIIPDELHGGSSLDGLYMQEDGATIGSVHA